MQSPGKIPFTSLVSVALLLSMCGVQSMFAQENWPLTVKVLSTKSVEDPHGSFHLAKVFDNASGKTWTLKISAFL